MEYGIKNNLLIRTKQEKSEYVYFVDGLDQPLNYYISDEFYVEDFNHQKLDPQPTCGNLQV